MTKIELQYVHFIPNLLKPGVLYYSKEYGIAVHLCACGCGLKVRTPIDSTEWTLTEENNVPSLDPSIGNWQLPCQSHYWIYEGKIIWSIKWTKEQIEAGRLKEEERRQLFYDALYKKRTSLWIRLLDFVKKLFSK